MSLPLGLSEPPAATIKFQLSILLFMKMNIVYSTFASKSDFDHMAELLLANGLIACANCWEINSKYPTYHNNDVKLWKGKEYAGFFKTTGRECKKACDFIAKSRKYGNPAIISLLLCYEQSIRLLA